MKKEIETVTTELHGIGSSRRRFVVGLASFTVASCGGGGGDSTTQTSSAGPSAGLTAISYPTNGATASATLKNGSDDGFVIWTNPSTQALTQAQYQFGASKYRVYYGPSQEVQRVVSESTGEYLSVTAVNGTRTDYNLYSNSGTWQNGWAIIKNADNSYSTAQILGTSNLGGQQLTVGLSGSVTASMSLLPSAYSGLGPMIPLQAGSTPITLAAAMTVRAGSGAIGNRLLDMFIGSAYAASAPSSIRGTIGGAVVGTMGGFLLAGAGGAVGLQLAGVALISYGAYQIYKNLKGIQDGGFDILDSASAAFLDSSTNSLGKGMDPIKDLQSKIQDYFAAGLLRLPSPSGIVTKIKNTASSAADTLQLLSSSSWQPTTSSPPFVDSSVSGLAVDSLGNSYNTNGTYSPNSGNLSFQTNTVNGRQISGTANQNTQNGSYLVTSSSGSSSGTATVKVEPLGACQTVQNSGGQGAFTKVYDMGVDSGTFPLTYDMYSIPDALTIKGSTGATLYSTGQLVSGSKSVQVPFSGGRFIYVTLNAPNNGTAWNYSIGCPV